MVRCHAVDHFRTDLVALADLHANFHMRSSHFVVERLTDVVQECTLHNNGGIRTNFFCEHTSQVRHFHRVFEDVLTIACAKT